MKELAPPAYRPLIYSCIFSIPLLVMTFLFPDNGQCPDSYTQAQVDATGCTVGASIGPSVLTLQYIAVSVLLTGIIASIVLRKRPTEAKKSPSKKNS